MESRKYDSTASTVTSYKFCAILSSFLAYLYLKTLLLLLLFIRVYMPLFKEINTFVYFEFLHGHIQHVNSLDGKNTRFLDHFNG